MPDLDFVKPDWLERDADGWSDMADTLTGVGLTVPVTPAWAERRLHRSAAGWAWSTTEDISPWAVYSIIGEIFPSPLAELLAPRRADFWLYGHRGYGANSMSTGLVARCGQLFVAQQHAWGGGYMDNEVTTQLVNESNYIWTDTALMLENEPSGPVRAAVLFSSFRGYAELWVPDGGDEPRSQERFVPDGWKAIWSQRASDPLEQLFALHGHDDRTVALGARHLAALLLSAGLIPSDGTTARGTLEPQETAVPEETDPPDESKPADDARPSLLPRSFPDTPEQRVGLNELVDALLIPHYDDRADGRYWAQLVELTCVVFGLDGRTEYLQMAAQQVPTRVLPLQGAMEVPEEIGAGFHGIDDLYGRVEGIQSEMCELQREFFRGVLLRLDPTIAKRRTTIGRLRELGLRERSYRSYDDEW